MKTRTLGAIVCIILVLVLSVSTGCASKGGTSSTGDIKIAFEGPITGMGAQDVLLSKNAVELAVKEFNDLGGVDGKKVTLEFGDDKADPKEAANLANKYVNDASIRAVVMGFNSSCTLAAAPIYNKQKITQMNWFAVSPAITDAGPYTFRVIPTGDLITKYLAKWLVKDDNLKNIAIFYENTDYGKGLADVLQKDLPEIGGKVVAAEAFLMDNKDFSAVINKFKALNPDAVVIIGQYEAAALWAKQSRDLGFKKPLYGTDGIYAPAMIDLAKEAAEGIKAVGEFSPESDAPAAKKFMQAYKSAYGSEPSTTAGFAYDAVNVVLEALKKGGATREDINKYLTTLKNYEGVTGMISFDENGDRMYQEDAFIKLEVKDGKWVLVK